MYVEQLRAKCGKDWSAIRLAAEQTAAKLGQLRQLLQQPEVGQPSVDSADLSVVVFGSLARGEWTSGSDPDWTLLIDGQVDHEHARTAQLTAELIKRVIPKDPGPTGTFGTMSFSHNLIHQIGGQDDSNRNTTQRMLLLLESRAVNRSEAYERVIRGILRRYLKDDFRAFRPKVPRFLLNDVHRFWRTMCVDYANKYRDRAGKGWALRNVKLRMSRKLTFAAGLLTCYSCHPDLLAGSRPDLAEEPSVEGMVEYLRELVARPPLEVVAEGMVRYGSEKAGGALLDAYDAFLARLDDASVRERLEKLPPEEAERDAVFQELQEGSRSFQGSLGQLFFEGRIAELTREYGVF